VRGRAQYLPAESWRLKHWCSSRQMPFMMPHNGRNQTKDANTERILAAAHPQNWRLPTAPMRPWDCEAEEVLVNLWSNWRALWKNQINSTSMKLRKSLVKPLTRQNISSCSVLSPEIVMHDAFNVILWKSADICVVMHDNLGWKNRTTRYILPHHWLYEWFSSAANVCRYMRWAWWSWVKEPNNTL